MNKECLDCADTTNCYRCPVPTKNTLSNQIYNPWEGSENVDLKCETIDCDTEIITGEPENHLWFKSPDGWLCPECSKKYWKDVVRCVKCDTLWHRDTMEIYTHDKRGSWSMIQYICAEGCNG